VFYPTLALRFAAGSFDCFCKRPGRHGVTRSVPAVPDVAGGPSHRRRTAVHLVFGGPLLGGPDRHQRAAAVSPTGTAARMAIASPTTRPRLRFGTTPTHSCCASRAPVRARAVGRPWPIESPALASRRRHLRAAPTKRRRRSKCLLRT